MLPRPREDLSRFGLHNRYRHAPRRCDLAVPAAPPRRVTGCTPRFRADGRTGLSHRDAVVVLARRARGRSRGSRARRPARGVRQVFGKKSAEDAVSAVDGAGPSSAAAAAMDPADGPSVLSLADRADHSWTRHLVPDPETERRAPNRSSREVKSGHFVRVRPAPLRNPRVALYSKAMAANVGIEARSRVRAVSRVFLRRRRRRARDGYLGDAVALSIMGKRQFQNCPLATTAVRRRTGGGVGRFSVPGRATGS